MDLSSLIIGLVLMSLFVIPIFFLSRKKASKDKQLLSHFTNIAEQQELKISQNDIWSRNYFIGIDQDANKLIYIKKTNENDDKVLFGLKEVELCRVDNVIRTIKEGKYSSNVTDRIDLKFKLKNSNAFEKTIEFYNAHGTENVILTNELELAEKWAKVINHKVRSLK